MKYVKQHVILQEVGSLDSANMKGQITFQFNMDGIKL